ncbi:FAD-binding oxidoreductase [Paraburkholderia sediminicola]|uniref:FAD-binding oxidoreductase n=1 Tax=Paraburkholderia sediminicola TaxID=458836 RepID=UPI0038BAFB4F
MDLTRREFLFGAGLIAASAIGGEVSAEAEYSPKILADKPDILPGRTFWRGNAQYERIRVGIVWNGYKPSRYPAVIVQPVNAQEVAAAVRFAADHGIKIKARSGGHSWTASFMRDDAMVIDLGALNSITIDLKSQTALLGPAVHGDALQKALVPHDLFFPTGHCPDVAVGGFLLQGGWGWNVPMIGLSNGLLNSIEVVTATGEIIHASLTENDDYFWAARGASAGFFGVVTGYNVRLLPRQKMRLSQSLYRREDLPALLAWATALGPRLPREIEMNLFLMKDLDKIAPEGFAMVNMVCFAPTDSQAIDILTSADTCPIKGLALIHDVAKPTTVLDMYETLGHIYRKGLRFGADNMLSNAPPAEISGAIMQMVANLPTPNSHVLWFPVPIERVQTNTSLSIMGTNYLVGYGACVDPADDVRVQSWASDHMKRFEPLAVGMQLGDENLARRPDATILRPGASARLEALRKQHDPNGVFLSYYRGNAHS